MDSRRIPKQKINSSYKIKIKGIFEEKEKAAILLFLFWKEMPLIRENPKAVIRFIKQWKKVLKNSQKKESKTDKNKRSKK